MRPLLGSYNFWEFERFHRAPPEIPRNSVDSFKNIRGICFKGLTFGLSFLLIMG